MFLLQPHQTSAPTMSFPAGGGGVVDAQLSADGATLMALCEDGSVHLWDAETGEHRLALGSDSVKATNAQLSPRGTYLLVVTDSGIAQVFDVDDCGERAQFHGHQRAISSSCFLRDESAVVTASADGIFIWPPRDDAPVVACNGQTGYPITAIDVSPDNDRIATVSHLDRSIVVWDVESGKPVAFDKQNEENRPTQAVFDPTGEHLVVPTIHGHGETRVLRFDNVSLADMLESPRLFLHSLPGMDDRDPVPLLTIAETLDGEWGRQALFSPDGRTLAIRHQSSDIVLWDWEARRKLRTFTHDDEMITRMSFSPDGRYLLIAPGVPPNIIPDGSKWDARIARVWDLADGGEALVLHGHTDLVMNAVFDARGEKIVTASKDGTVLVWSGDSQASMPLSGGAGDTPVVRALCADAAAIRAAHEDDAPMP